MDIDISIFKGYDIRGIYPNQINEDLAYKIGQAYVEVVKPKGEILLGHDVRLHSESLKNKMIEGINDAGVDAVDVGWMSTDMLYFGVGNYKLAGGIQVTASHNPPEWHGAKMVTKGPTPTTLEDVIGQIRDYILKDPGPIKFSNKGKVRKMNILDDYCKYILTWIADVKVRPLKIVINPNFGYGGVIFKKIVEMGKLPIEIVGLNDTPDGTFPKGRPDPFIPENRPEFVELVKSSNADFGIAWDADSDRVFFCADGGVFIEPYYLNTILISHMLKVYPGEKIIYDPRYTWALIDTVKENGGIPVISKVGHSYIKQKMREENAYFGGESSGHTYYRDYWFSDCGMIPPIQIIDLISQGNEKLSQMVKPIMERYFISEEINSEVKNIDEKLELIKKTYSDAEQSSLDGIAIEYKNYRFCVRPSNTEPLLRLTLEAKTPELVKEKTNEILKLIRS